jgi:hypothetical protein
MPLLRQVGWPADTAVTGGLCERSEARESLIAHVESPGDPVGCGSERGDVQVKAEAARAGRELLDDLGDSRVGKAICRALNAQ